jgi:pimeloyl-ACP methyl ester carboxylesterase
VIDELAKDYRVTAFDRPGHGYSGSHGDLYTYDYHAGVAIELIEALHLRDVVVVGHSYGGGTALAVALRKPDQVKSIVVLDSAVYELLEKPDSLYRVLSIPGFGTGFARLIGPAIAPKKIRAGLFAQFPTGAPPEGFIETRTEIWNQPKVTISISRESLRADAEMAAMSRHYKDIAYPTFIAAQANQPGRRESAERLQREINGSELLLLRNTGHYVQFQKTIEVIGLIRKAAGGSDDSISQRIDRAYTRTGLVRSCVTRRPCD